MTERRGGEIMRIVIGKNTERFMSVLGITSYPFSPEILSSQFKVAIKTHHPDNGGKKEKAQEIIEAYKNLKNLAVSVSKEDTEEVLRRFEEQDGDLFKLWEDCKQCNGKGHLFSRGYRNKGCRLCNFIGLYYMKTVCRSCKGTGKFKQKLGRVVDCFTCKGTGHFENRHRRFQCPFCKEESLVKFTCLFCSGTGKVELKPFNPVIPKGAVL